MKTNDFNTLIDTMLARIQVDVAQALDRNFENQSFFGRAWQRRRSPLRQGRPTLIDTGSLRRSIKARRDTSQSITFSTSHPAAEIHNTGGQIRVTARMKRYFWHCYYACSDAFGRRKDGSLRRDKRTVRLTTEAEFWRAMALMKVGSTITIPQRQFIGISPEVEDIARRIVENTLERLGEKVADNLNDNLKD